MNSPKNRLPRNGFLFFTLFTMTPDEPILVQNVSAMEENIKEFFKHLWYLRDIAYRVWPSGELWEAWEDLEIQKEEPSINGRMQRIVKDMNTLRYQMEKVENHFNRLV